VTRLLGLKTTDGHGLLLVYFVRSDGHRPNGFAFDVENGPQVGGYLDCVDGAPVMRRKFVDFVRAQPGIKGVGFEDLKRGFGGAFLFGREFLFGR
jgi:hypothetical protein